MKNGRDTINQTAWIDAAYELLIASGVSAVKIVPLAKKLKTSRTTLNVFDCWFDPAVFDSEFEYAIRSWSLQDQAVAKRVSQADILRLQALKNMFIRYGYDPSEADTRARTVYLIQIGYISMHTQEPQDTRIGRVAQYINIFTGQLCTHADLERFAARHKARFTTEEMAAQQEVTDETDINARHYRR